MDARQQVVAAGAVTGETLAQLRAGKLFVRQLPGPKNSLGLVKFLFPNSYNVYMHDHPAPELFAQSRRDFSHGCIRLGKARRPCHLGRCRNNAELDSGTQGSRRHEERPR